MLHDLFTGISQLATPEAMGLLVVGMAVGMFMGMLPGLGVSLALSLMLPFLYHMGVVPAVALMLATQAGSYYAASITAILLNTPGAPESFPTTLDGFPMAQRGEAGRALAISAASTWAGGWIACVALVGLLQIAGSLAGVFHPPEFVAVIVLALVLVGATSEATEASKVVLSGAIGLMFSFVGTDPVTAVERFTFGQPGLFNGISVVPFALGVFALTQMVLMFGRDESVAASGAVLSRSRFASQIGWGLRDTLANWFHVLRSAVVAAALGLIPGIGGFAANFISYGLGRMTSRRGGRFGTGVPAGIASAEGSSLAKEVSSLLPAVALGLPSGLGMVIFIAALSILGLEPGPSLLHSQPALPYTMMWVMAIAGLLSCGAGLLLTPWISRVTTIRGPLLMPFIVSLAVVGSYAATTSGIGLIELSVFATVGVVMRKTGYSLAAMTIGLVLGRTFTDNVHLTETIYGWAFVRKSPLADVILLMAAVLLVLLGRRARRERRAARADQQALALAEVGAAQRPHVGAVVGAAAAPAVESSTGGSVEPAQAAGLGPSQASSDTSLVRADRTEAPDVVAPPHSQRPEAHRLLEPIVLLVIVAVSLAYVVTSLGYPSAAGTIPAVVGAVACATAALRLGSWGIVHLVRRGERRGAPALAPSTSAGSAEEGKPRPRSLRELAALGWIWLAVVASYLIGFEIGLPLAVVAYAATALRWRRSWQRVAFTICAGGCAFAVSDAFIALFHLTFIGKLG